MIVKAFALYVVFSTPVSDIERGTITVRTVYNHYDTEAECRDNFKRALHAYKVKGHRPYPMVVGCAPTRNLSDVRVSIGRAQ